jgi:ketosteroid isomerase-like protein
MTGASLGLILLLSAGPAGIAFASDPSPGTGQASSAEAEIRKLSAEEVQAFLRRDADALARLWSDDFVVTNPLNRFVTKRDVLEMVTSGVLVITAFEREIEYLKVYGDTAVVAGRETVVWGGRMPAAGRALGGRGAGHLLGAPHLLSRRSHRPHAARGRGHHRLGQAGPENARPDVRVPRLRTVTGDALRGLVIGAHRYVSATTRARSRRPRRPPRP